MNDHDNEPDEHGLYDGDLDLFTTAPVCGTCPPHHAGLSATKKTMHWDEAWRGSRARPNDPGRWSWFCAGGQRRDGDRPGGVPARGGGGSAGAGGAAASVPGRP